MYPSQWAFKLNLSPDSEEPRTLHLEDLTFLIFLMFQKLGFYHLPPESQIEFDHSSLIILTLREFEIEEKEIMQNCIAILRDSGVVVFPCLQRV